MLDSARVVAVGGSEVGGSVIKGTGTGAGASLACAGDGPENGTIYCVIISFI